MLPGCIIDKRSRNENATAQHIAMEIWSGRAACWVAVSDRSVLSDTLCSIAVPSHEDDAEGRAPVSLGISTNRTPITTYQWRPLFAKMDVLPRTYCCDKWKVARSEIIRCSVPSIVVDIDPCSVMVLGVAILGYACIIAEAYYDDNHILDRT